MYIQTSKSKGKNGKIYQTKLLCRKYREDGKPKTEIIANLSKFPQETVVLIENSLKSKRNTITATGDVNVLESVDYGLSYLILHLMKSLRIEETLSKTIAEYLPELKAVLLGKILTRGSKLGAYNMMCRENDLSNRIDFDTSEKKVDDLYNALGKLSFLRDKVAKKWFLYNKGKQKEIYYYDITSTYLEGELNALAAFGYNRDKKQGKLQIVIGLITDGSGRPLMIDVFQGDTQDNKTVEEQLRKLQKKFKCNSIIFVGDRGMKIKYHLDKLLENEEGYGSIKYITGITHNEIKNLIKRDVIQLGLFDKNLVEIEDSNERYVLSVNPDLEKRERAYLKTKKEIVDEEIEAIKKSWETRRNKNIDNKKRVKEGDKNKKLKTKFSQKDIDQYKVRVDRILVKNKMQKYYDEIVVKQNEFFVTFNDELYNNAMNLSGRYVFVTNLKKTEMSKEDVKNTYKNLQKVEHAFRDFKSDNIQIRPIFHINEHQTRGHVLMAMFSYAVIREMELKIYPFIKEWNKSNKRQLGFNDIIEELKQIKLCKIQIDNGLAIPQITNMTDIRRKILMLFDITEEQMRKTA